MFRIRLCCLRGPRLAPKTVTIRWFNGLFPVTKERRGRPTSLHRFRPEMAVHVMISLENYGAYV